MDYDSFSIFLGNYGFPIVCLCAIGYFVVKYLMPILEKYLETQNEVIKELKDTLSDNTKTLAENTKILAQVLEHFKE